MVLVQLIMPTHKQMNLYHLRIINDRSWDMNEPEVTQALNLIIMKIFLSTYIHKTMSKTITLGFHLQIKYIYSSLMAKRLLFYSFIYLFFFGNIFC